MARSSASSRRKAPSAAASSSTAPANGRAKSASFPASRVPLQSVQHQYLVTEPIAGVPRNLPTLRDPDRLIYFKEEVGGLVMGGYEPNPIPWALDGIPPGLPLRPARFQLRIISSR